MAAGYHYGVKLRITPTGLSPASAAASLAALPPPPLPGFLGTTGPSATPTGPACPSRDSGWCVPHHRRGFPCCVLFPSFMHASANTPAGAASASIALFPAATGLPLFPRRVDSHIARFGACSAFYGLFPVMRCTSPIPLWNRGQGAFPQRITDCVYSDCRYAMSPRLSRYDVLRAGSAESKSATAFAFLSMSISA